MDLSAIAGGGKAPGPNDPRHLGNKQTAIRRQGSHITQRMEVGLVGKKGVLDAEAKRYITGILGKKVWSRKHLKFGFNLRRTLPESCECR